MKLKSTLAVLAILYPSIVALGSPPTRLHRVEMPQSDEFCEFGTFSPPPNPTGIERLVVGPPAGVNITKTRLIVTFVTSDACEPNFDAADILLSLSQVDLGIEWLIRGDVDLAWTGQGTFTASVESDLFNGPNPSRLWSDAYYAQNATQIPGHFHNDVNVVDSFWEFEYSDNSILFGDANCDGFINFQDIEAFTLGLVDSFEYAQAYPLCTETVLDVNCDGAANGNDIPAFINAIFTAPPVGACCLPGGSCEILSEFECTAFGTDGTYQGNLTDCQSTGCPISSPQILSTSFFPSPVDNCNGTRLSFDVFGQGFNLNAVVELVRAGSDPVLIRPLGITDHTFLFTQDFETECITDPGMWDLRVTNPDGGTVTASNVLEVTACTQPPIQIDSVVYTPSPIETCAGTGPSNPPLMLTAIIEGSSLPNEFFLGSDFTKTQVSLRDAVTGDVFLSESVSNLTQLSATEFGVMFTIYQGNVFFPTSNPPPGTYEIVVETCSGVYASGEAVEIMPADPGMCPN